MRLPPNSPFSGLIHAVSNTAKDLRAALRLLPFAS
jgi:hypothetical protein